MKKGLIIRSTGSWYELIEEVSNNRYSCRTAGKMKLLKKDLSNPIGVGDFVEFEPENENQGIIHNIHSRKNYIVRQSPKNKHQLHLIAANIDLAVLVTTLKQPTFKPGFIDRFLITTEPQNIPVLIVFNKSDIWEESELLLFEECKSIYNNITFGLLEVSTVTLKNIDLLKEKILGKTCLVAGQSGVGKSSLLNVLQPGIGLKTSEISSSSGKGTHTTTFAEMFILSDGTRVIDTTGIKTLSFNNIEIMDVAHNFKEFFETSVNCRFGSQCTHRNEPGCAVKSAIESGHISFQRYQNYLNLVDEIESQNY